VCFCVRVHTYIFWQAILRRLGAKDPSELRAEIVSVFNLFDTDGSGIFVVCCNVLQCVATCCNVVCVLYKCICRLIEYDS